MAGRGKLCLGYCNDPSPYPERVARLYDVKASPDGRLIDPDGLTVEDFGLPDNLMMIHALDLHGCPLVTPRIAPADLWHDLTSFEACVRLAADAAPSKPGESLGEERAANPLRASARTCCWSSAACSKAGRGRRRRSTPASSSPTASRWQKPSENIAADAA